MNDRESFELTAKLEDVLIDHLSDVTIGPSKYDDDKHTIRTMYKGTIYEIVVKKAKK